MSQQSFDLIVLGGGPAGRAAALKASREGMTVALVDEVTGGESIARGYFPLKVLISMADLMNRHQWTGLNEMGNQGEYRDGVLLTAMDRVRKARLAWQNALLDAGVRFYRGEAVLAGRQQVQIKPPRDQEEPFEPCTLFGEQLLIATGAKPDSPVAGLDIDGEKVLSHEHLVSADFSTFHDILIIGGNVEGVEFASLLNNLGIPVTLIEQEDTLLPGCDREMVARLEQCFLNRGIQIVKNCHVKSGDLAEEGVVLETTTAGEPRTFHCGKALVTGKRVPSIPKGVAGLMDLTPEGFISVNSSMQTRVASIYAVGDVTGGILSANAAIQEAETAVTNMKGTDQAIDRSTMPFMFFTSPGFSGVGLTEEGAQKAGKDYVKVTIDFSENLKALSFGSDEGMLKVLVDKRDRTLLGVQVLGDDISELIALPADMYRERVPIDGVADLPVPHPTLNELFFEALKRIET